MSTYGCKGDEENKQAQVRMLNVSAGYESVDLYARSSDDSADQLRIDGVPRNSVSDYSAFKSGAYAIKFKRHGASNTLQTLSGRNLSKNTHRTFVAYGSAGNFTAQEIDENVPLPGSGQTRVQVLNTAEAGKLDVYLTDSSVPLEDASPTFSGVAHAGLTSTSSIDSAAYRLRVVGTNDIDDVRLDVPDVKLGDKDMVTLILTASEGGILVNASVLQQRGGLTNYPNSKVRVRGAVGISNGAVVTAKIGGVTVLTRTPVGVIGTYAQVDVGTAAVSVDIDGNAVAVPNQTLRSGSDYTLLVWNNAAGAQGTWIADDNRLPATAGKAKIRVINGLSALAAPITLAVDFSPVVEAVAPGQASAFAEVDGGSDYQIDVTDSGTATNLLSRSSVSLQSGGVYTLLVSANATSVSGTLRKDR